MPIDLERQSKAKEYARIRHRLLALDLILSAIAFLIVLATGLGVWLRDQVMLITGNPWLSTGLYLIIGFLGYGLLFLPITFYSSFVLPHRYGLSTQGLRGWLWDAIKGAALGLVFGLILIEVIYALLRAAPDWWWLFAAIFMLLFNVILANLAPVLIMPLFIKFRPLEDKELVDRLLRLSERAHTRVRGVYTMMLSEKTTAANAALMGLGNTRRIVLGDTLYRDYSHDEIETILAHELGHQVNNDIPYAIAFESVLTLAGFFIAGLFLTAGVSFFHLRGVSDPATMPLLALAVGVFGLLTAPLGNAYSRWRESLADMYALSTTQNAPAFVGAMEKLANQNLAELQPEPWVEFLLYDHPPIGRRLEMGQRFRAGNA